jgi:hypothetical protein
MSSGPYSVTQKMAATAGAAEWEHKVKYRHQITGMQVSDILHRADPHL